MDNQNICSTCKLETVNAKGHTGNPWACITALRRKLDASDNWIKVAKFWQKQGRAKDKTIEELQIFIGLLLQGHRFSLDRYQTMNIPMSKETKSALRKQEFEAIKADIMRCRAKIMKALAR